jgi:BirA family biotin operon repressor/biotin-[acetyl-CoA-carboxylase] ligase
LRITRPAVWKQIRHLQSMGFPIESVARAGYRLTIQPDFSLQKELPLHGEVKHWARANYFLQTASTQTLCKRAAVAGAPEGYLAIAEIQTAGRGRLGREWSSGYGGLWFSLLLRPSTPPSRVTSIALVAALALCQTIRQLTGCEAALKWPNDILLPDNGGWKKGAGFLTEMSGESDKTDWVVIGVGLNVFNELSAPLKATANRLRDVHGSSAPLPSRANLLAEYLHRFFPAYKKWQRDGFKAFRDDYWSHYARPNATVKLKTAGRTISGIPVGVDDSGAIIIESKKRANRIRRTILEGEIVL